LTPPLQISVNISVSVAAQCALQIEAVPVTCPPDTDTDTLRATSKINHLRQMHFIVRRLRFMRQTFGVDAHISLGLIYFPSALAHNIEGINSQMLPDKGRPAELSLTLNEIESL